MTMPVDELLQQALSAVESASSLQQLEEVKVRYLGRRGSLTAVLRRLGQLPGEERRATGQAANVARQRIEESLAARQAALQEQQRLVEQTRRRLDVTLPGRYPRPGLLHPLTRVGREICDIFIGLGFEVASGPELETEYYNFQALNFPEHHPVMDEHDSFYVGEGRVLRTETSAVQIRTMEQRRPPVRIVAPGRCYRRDTVDARHSHTFQQVEGLYVDRGVRFSDLKGTLALFAQRMFGPKVQVRFRPDYFPFTEPSADMSVTCMGCDGAGCRICSYTGWLELLGCGMVHPNVLHNVGYDPEEFTGFAFGMGVERIAMRRLGIPDIRIFYQNDLRILRQL
jgi:phenylalanyl-tRNA synthetase alpha chain